MQNTDVAVRLLRRLRDQGFRVALDDFGTGYSSLAYLRDLPISALKIDRSFVAGITEHPDVLAIVASIVDLAGAVGVDVVAEGVETPGQRALLQRLGVTAAQGWLWSAALPYAALLGGGACTGPLAAAPTAESATTRRRPGDPGVVHGVQRLLELHRHGASVDAIAATLDAEGHRTPAGLRWQPTSVARVIAHQIRRAAGPPDGCTGARRPVRGEGRMPRLDGLGQLPLRPSGGAAGTPATPFGQD
jgi:hypothetical protein